MLTSGPAAALALYSSPDAGARGVISQRRVTSYHASDYFDSRPCPSSRRPTGADAFGQTLHRPVVQCGRPRSPPQSSKSSSSKSSAVKGESDQDTPCGGVGSGPAGWFAVEGSPGSGLCFLLLLPAAPSSFCLVCTSCSAPPAHPAAFGGCSSIIAKLIALLCRFVGVRRAPVGAPPSVGGGRAVVGGALALLAFLHARAQPNTTNTHAATHDHNMHTLNLQSSCKWRSSAC